MNLMISAIIGYLIGSIPFALVIGKLFYKVDVRQHGSGNLGASNAGRTLGKKAAVAVTILDALKCVGAMCLVFLLGHSDPTYSIVIAGFMAAVGHCFPLFARFKGGKAVATIQGYFLGLCIFQIMPFWIFLLSVGSFFLILKITKYVSLSALCCIGIVCITCFVIRIPLPYCISIAFLWLLTTIRHRENITRLLNKSERKITWM